MTPGQEALRFLRTTRHGVLSTHSAKFPGYPFGSVAPFVLDHQGQPLILISTIAEHTKNIIADPHVSLIAFDPAAADMQSAGRLTLMGEACEVPKEALPLRERYLRYFPQAAQYFDMHDFRFYRIAVREARYIGGFGNIHWLPTESLKPPVNQLAEQESAILSHMNADHADSLRLYCQHGHQVSPLTAVMTGIDTEGFDVRADDVLLRFEFDAPVTDAQSARMALVKLSRAAGK